MRREPMTYRGVVYPWHCDPATRMNVMGYVGKFNDASLQLYAMLGLTPEWLRAHGHGVQAAEQHLRYLREVQDGDVVTVATRVLELSGRAIRWRHEMREEASGELAATCEIVGHVAKEGGAISALPEFVAQRVDWL